MHAQHHPFDVPSGGAELPAPSPVPRISRLLARALKMEQMIQDGTVKTYGELAYLGQVSAARITQVMSLLHLAPDIQEVLNSEKARCRRGKD